MLERVWRKGNPLTLLVTQTNTATMENSVEIPLKNENRTAIQLMHFPKETRMERDTYPNVRGSIIYNSQDMEAT